MSSTLLLQVLRGCYGLSKNRSYLRIKTTTIFRQVSAVLTFTRTGRSHTRFNESWRNRHPPATCVQSTSVEPVSGKRTRNVGTGRFIQQYRRTKVLHAGKQYD